MKEQQGLVRVLSSATSSFLEECIGCESCLDLNTHTQDHLLYLFPKPTTAPRDTGNYDDGDEEHKKEEVLVLEQQQQANDEGCSVGNNDNKSSSSVMKEEKPRWKKEYPPPIPLLARTENLASHMPWVLKRQYTSDGRLVLTEEKVWRHHEYFRAQRSNGRLTLQLVPLEFHDHDDDDDDDDDHLFDISAVPHDDDDDDSDGCNNELEHLGYDDERDDCDEDDEGGFHRSENAVKCLNYNSMMRGSPTSCIFGIPVIPTLRPVLG